jgi:phospholipase/carboxylesterase
MAVRFVFPHAPMQPVTINGGMVMRAWYDIRDAEIRREDAAGIEASRQHVEALIARERGRGTPDSRIVLAGFSQGGAIALHTGLRHDARLAGVLALSCYLPLADRLAAEASAGMGTHPIGGRSAADPIVPFPRAVESRDFLQRLGYDVEWHEYRMPHSVCAEEISHIGAWLRRLV